MKKFAKLLMSFALVGFVAACTNDVTEDAALNVPVSGSVKTLTLALDGQTRVELGERTADDKYPVYWQEGDALRINEGATTAINIHEDKSVADFTFAVADADVYSVVYPYVEGLTAATEGCLPVKFAEVQNYTEGSFEAASFPMYGYAEGEELTGGLNYLAGILAFELKGAGEILTKVELTVTEGAIAGTFDVNCQTGELKAQADASKKLTYMLPADGLALSENATVLYIAVPAGDYGTMQAKFCTTNAEVAMMAGVPCTGDKAVKAGVVREFKNIEFKDNDSDVSGAMFEIYDESSLFEFAEMCKAGAFEYAGAEVTRSFAVTADGWEPIEGFTGLFEGNDNTIRELTKPLFGTTSGTIQNLKVRSNLVVVDDIYVGAIVSKLISTAEQTAAVINCSTVEGSTIELASELADTAADDDGLLHRVGGVVGYALNARIENTTNYASMTVTKVANYSGSIYNMVGGIVGHIGEDESKTQTVVSGCANHGAITITGIKVDKAIFYVSGIIARLACGNISECTNEGAITITDSEIYYYYTGGIVGTYPSGAKGESVIDNCHNKAEIKLTESASVVRYQVGGIIGNTQLPTMMIKSCTNAGKMGFYGATHGTSNGRVMIGGVAGLGSANFKDCTNLATGEIYVTGTFNEIDDNVSFTIGGCVGVNNNGTSNVFVVEGLKNYAPVTVDEPVINAVYNDAKTTIQVAGIMGYSNVTKDGCVIRDAYNEGKVTLRYTTGQTVRMGGIMGYNKTPLTGTETMKLHNKGDIEFICNGYVGGYVGGIAGNYADSAKGPAEYMLNEGNITIKLASETRTRTIYGGGLIGNNTVEANYGENRGDITVESPVGADNAIVNQANPVHIGGCIGGMSAAATNLSNSGNITVKNIKYYSGTDCYLRIGGCIAYVSVSTENYTKLTNSGAITVDNVAGDDATYIGGLLGYLGKKDTRSHTVALKEANNSGAISVTNHSKGSMAIGGLVGACMINLTGTSAAPCTNTGNMIVDIVPVHSYIGGAVGISRGKISYVNNTGTLTSTSHGTASYRVGGVVGYLYDCNVTADVTDAAGNVTEKKNLKVVACERCVNSGAITSTAGLASGQDWYVGGVIGYTAGNSRYCTNEATGTINMYGSATTTVAEHCRYIYVGGVAGSKSNADADTNQDNINHANITIDSSIKIKGLWAAGVVGYQNGYAKQDQNHGDIEINCTIAGSRNCYIAGVAARSVTSGRDKCTNTGNITFNGTTGEDVYCSIGGCVGWMSIANDEDNKNSGNITIGRDAVIGKVLFVGGVVGYGASTQCATENSGNISILGTLNCDTYVGGIVGFNGTSSATTANKIYNTKTSGAITVRPNGGEYGGNTFIGAVGGLTDCENTIADGGHEVDGTSYNVMNPGTDNFFFNDHDATRIYFGVCGPFAEDSPYDTLIAEYATALA